MSSFQAGELVVYPPHGVSVISGIERRSVAGKVQTFYVLRLQEGGTTVFLPTHAAATKGLRAVSSAGEARRALRALQRREETTEKRTWSQRQRDYLERLRSGTLLEVAEVLRELTLIGLHKELSYSERRVLLAARRVLVEELAAAQGQTAARVERQIDAIFS